MSNIKMMSVGLPSLVHRLMSVGLPNLVGRLMSVGLPSLVHRLMSVGLPDSVGRLMSVGSRNLVLRLASVAIVMLVAVESALPATSAQLPRERLDAWEEYVRLTEGRIASELAGGGDFLVQDFEGGQQSAEARAELLAGELVVSKMTTRRADDEKVDVPGGMIHHWRGAILIPGVTLDEVLEDVMYPDTAEYQQEDVLETRVLDRGDDWLDLYLKLERSKIVTATYNTEHRVEYTRHSGGRASSRTIATYVRELDDAGTPREREKAEGDDRGFLWRLNSYWRYEQVEEGVLVECESLTLSRSIPFFIAPFVRPMVTGVAKESMDRTLTGLRDRMAVNSL